MLVELKLIGLRSPTQVMNFIKKLYDFDFGEDKSVFDLIINTDNLTAQQVIDVTKETVRKLL